MNFKKDNLKTWKQWSLIIERNISVAYPPFCKFNILNFLPRAHVLKCRIDPDRLTLFLLLPTACQSETARQFWKRSVIGKILYATVSHRFWKRELFSLCRGYWSAVTKCPRNTCLWQTSYTTWGTTLAIRSFNADVTMTFSSFGCNGAPRYKIHYIVRELPLCFLVIHRLYSSLEEHYKQHYSTVIYQFLLR